MVQSFGACVNVHFSGIFNYQICCPETVKNYHKPSMVVHVVIAALWEAEARGLKVQGQSGQPGVSPDPVSKKKSLRRGCCAVARCQGPVFNSGDT